VSHQLCGGGRAFHDIRQLLGIGPEMHHRIREENRSPMRAQHQRQSKSDMSWARSDDMLDIIQTH
jgi:hypothetical protein